MNNVTPLFAVRKAPPLTLLEAEVALATANVSIVRLSTELRLMGKDFSTQLDTILTAINEIEHGESRAQMINSTEKIRKVLLESIQLLFQQLERLVEPVACGHADFEIGVVLPESALHRGDAISN